jgi:hypothetical protein
MTENDRMTRSELAAALGCDEAFVLLLEEEQIVLVEGDVYESVAIERARVCWNLYEVGVNTEGLEVVVHLLDRLFEERRQHLRTIEWLREQLSAERSEG